MDKRTRFLAFLNKLSVSEFDAFLLDLREFVEMFDDFENYPAAFPIARRVYKEVLIKE